jgi:hypothetical protein
VAYRFYDHDYKFFSAFGVSPVAHERPPRGYHGDLALPVAGTFSYGVDFDRENGSVASQSHVETTPATTYNNNSTRGAG